MVVCIILTKNLLYIMDIKEMSMAHKTSLRLHIDSHAIQEPVIVQSNSISPSHSPPFTLQPCSELPDRP
jgi:hypothetical protein